MAEEHHKPYLDGADTWPATKAIVREAIDAAEPEFEWCLKAIAPLGGHQADREFANSFVTFQMRLLDAIAALKNVYRRVKQEEKRLIAHKRTLNNDCSRRRMAKLAFYRKALAGVLAIGRAIGDGFAWFFYEWHREKEHDLIARRQSFPVTL